MTTRPTQPLAETTRSKQSSELPRVFLMTNTLETGGSERQFVTLANSLDCNVYSIHLGCLRRIGPFLEQVPAIAEFSPGGNLFKWQSQRARLRLARHLRRLGVAVAHAFDFYSNLMLIPAAQLAGVPVVIGSHRQIGDLLTSRQFWAQRMVLRLATRVVCNSRAAADSLRAAGVPEMQLRVIPNGIQDENFAVRASTKEPGVITVGMISRMNDRIKQHDLFLRVAAKLAARFPQLVFVLVGDGPLRPEFERLAENLQLAGRVKFLGDRRDISAVLANLDISVLPSASESLSNVILESMAAGLPVVASRAGGNPELIEEGVTGFLCEIGNELEFAGALERLIADRELRLRLGARARHHAAQTYSITNVRKLYQDLYHAELSAKGWVLPNTVESLEASHTLS